MTSRENRYHKQKMRPEKDRDMEKERPERQRQYNREREREKEPRAHKENVCTDTRSELTASWFSLQKQLMISDLYPATHFYPMFSLSPTLFSPSSPSLTASRRWNIPVSRSCRPPICSRWSRTVADTPGAGWRWPADLWPRTTPRGWFPPASWPRSMFHAPRSRRRLSRNLYRSGKLLQTELRDLKNSRFPSNDNRSLFHPSASGNGAVRYLFLIRFFFYLFCCKSELLEDISYLFKRDHTWNLTLQSVIGERPQHQT